MTDRKAGTPHARDIFVRSHTVLEKLSKGETNTRKKTVFTKRGEESQNREVKQWPEMALIFDTETRTVMDGARGYQALTFGIFRICRLVNGVYRCEREGIFYSGESERKGVLRSSNSAILGADELNAIGTFVRDQSPDIEIPSFPPRVSLEVHQTFASFTEKVFWPAVRKGWLVVCLNSPFDLSRLCRESRPTSDREGFALIMGHRYWRKTKKWIPDPYRPVIRIRPKDARVAFIERGVPRFRGKKSKKIKPGGWDDWSQPFRPLDVGTLLKSLFDKHMGLDAWCEHFKIPGKLKTPDGHAYVPCGRVTPDELKYCRNDVLCTQHLLNQAKREFDAHGLTNLRSDKSYSAASVGKAYFKEIGIEKPSVKFADFPAEHQGIAMQSYQGGRAECHIRCTKLPVIRLDFVSQYPTVNLLLGNQKILLAESVEFEDATDEIKEFLKTVTLDKCFDQQFWKQLSFFARVTPDHDIFPTQAAFDPDRPEKQNIADCYLTSDKPLWKAGPDIVNSIIRNGGRVPQIDKAYRIVAKGVQKGLRPVRLLGEILFDPYNPDHDFFKIVIEAKEKSGREAEATKRCGDKSAEKKAKALKHALKIIANSTSYGVFVQLNEQKIPSRKWNKKKEKWEPLPPKNLQVFTGDIHKTLEGVKEWEKDGSFYFAPIASLICSGSRLLLGMAEQCVVELNRTYMACDTDSLLCVANRTGRAIQGNKSSRGDGIHFYDPQGKLESADIPALSHDQVREISKRFESLNPYSFKGTILKIEDINYENSDPKRPLRTVYGYSISAKRYCLWTEEKGKIKIVDAKAHGLGAFMSPIEPPKEWDEKWPYWIDEAWRYVLQSITHEKYEPEWLDCPLMQSVTVTTPHTLGVRLKNFSRPYDFVIAPVLESSNHDSDSDEPTDKPSIVGRFTKVAKDWLSQDYYDTRTGKVYHITTSNEPGKLQVKTYRRVLNLYTQNPELKALAPGGVHRCDRHTRGILVRDHVIVRNLIPCGKQSDPKQYEGSTKPRDGTHPHFTTRVYQNERQEKLLVFSDHHKKTIRKIGSREFRRMGFSWQTYEASLNGGVRPHTHKKILKVIQSQ